MALWLLLCCCLAVDAGGGCYDALQKDLADTLSAPGARPRYEPAPCDAAAPAPLEPVPGGGSLVRVSVRGDAPARLLLLTDAASAAQCRLQRPRDFTGRGRELRSWGRRRDRPPTCGTLPAPFGCLRLLRPSSAAGAEGWSFASGSVWLPPPASRVPGPAPPPAVEVLGSSASHVRVSHSFGPQLRGGTVAFYVRKTRCAFARRPQDVTWFVKLTGEKDSAAVACANDPLGQVTCQTTESLQVVCNVTKLSPGSYCLYAVVVDLCPWEESCVFFTPLAVSGGSPEGEEREAAVKVSAPGGAPRAAVALLAVALLGTSLCLALHFLWPQAPFLRSPWDVGPSPSPSPLTVSEAVDRKGAEVLLLYAYDCPPLMEAAEALRNLIAKVPGTEVFDLLDGGRWQEVGGNPFAWLLQLLSRRGLRVVLLETPCALLLQRAPFLRYRQPRAFADLFLQGLSVVLSTATTQDSYASHYVVRFEEEAEGRGLSHVTPWRRFLLPEAAEALLAELCPKRRAPDVPVGEELRALAAKVEAFRSYRSSHPGYLQDTLLERLGPSPASVSLV